MASSNINILGLLIRALAIAILCFCPPDNLVPFEPTMVSKPKGNLLSSKTKFAWDIFKLHCISLSYLSLLLRLIFSSSDKPYIKFSLIVPSKREGSWGT